MEKMREKVERKGLSVSIYVKRRGGREEKRDLL